MASATITIAAGGNTKEVAMETPDFVRVFKNGTIERLQNSPIVPPSVGGPKTGIASKDITPVIQCEQQDQKIPNLVYFHGGGFFFESAFNQLYQNLVYLFA